MASVEPEALSLGEALAEEYAAVTGLEKPAPTPDPENPESPPTHKLEDIQRLHFNSHTAALCLSGGGIRSAAFGLGVAQGLARRGMLKRFHYLSTVSGGGYIGSFLSAWAYRAEGGIAEVERELAKPRAEPPDGDDERDALRRLRRYSNYLSPRAGLGSLDGWTLIVTYLRNLLLNWLVLLPLLALAACVPFLVHAAMTAEFWESAGWLANAGVWMTVFGLFFLRWRTYSTGTVGLLRRYVRFDWLVLALLFGGAVLVAIDYHALVGDGILQKKGDAIRLAAITAVLGFFLGLAFVLVDLSQPRRRQVLDRATLLLGFVLTALLSVAAVVTWIGFVQLLPRNALAPDGWMQPLLAQSGDGVLLVILGPPAWLVLMLVPEVLFLGIAASLSDDHDREWWTRTVAFGVRAGVAWALVGAVILLGPGALALVAGLDWLQDIPGNVQLPALSALLALLLGGGIARRNFMRAATGAGAAQDGSARLGAERMLNACGLLLIIAILAGIAYYLREFLEFLRSGGGALMRVPALPEAATALGLALWCMLFGLAVHVNRYSLHAMYRERLARTFLAATRCRRPIPAPIMRAMGDTAPGDAARAGLLARLLWRVLPWESEPASEVWQFTPRAPDRFTDFDRHDNPLMQWLDPRRRGGERLAGYAEASSPEPAFVRAPLHVVNCALNMVGERDNALQERKAASFTFTPIHAGSARTGFRPAAEYGGPDGVTLATAMTISGAAVSPNAGQRSHPVSTFLMTLFNARLGWWLGHPRIGGLRRETGPRQSLVPLIDEMLGRTSSGANWIHLSDGGHFENLGLYEMVRRGCRYIVVADASADPSRHFDDLGNAIRKIRLDLSVEIREVETFNVGGRELGEEGRYAALFEIEYPWDDTRYGQLLYLKTALYRDNPLRAPMDVVEYGNRSPGFPHEPTSDQFFMETQFESYRALGEHEISSVMLQAEEGVPAIFVGAREHIADPFEKAVEK